MGRPAKDVPAIRLAAQHRPKPQSPALTADFDELRDERFKADERVEDFASRIDGTWLSEDPRWWRGLAKRDLMVHFFDHQTHHRGQAHAASTIFGIDPRERDLFSVVPGI